MKMVRARPELWRAHCKPTIPPNSALTGSWESRFLEGAEVLS